MGAQVGLPPSAHVIDPRYRKARLVGTFIPARRCEGAKSLVSKLKCGHFKTLSESVQKICTALGLDPRNPGGDQRIEAMIRRITALSAQTPQLLTAIDGVLDVLESANQGRR